MLDRKRNNLDKSLSPYLLQHQANPVWWQEWDAEVLKYASQEKKPLFVSVGYSTCHWCHVMAAGAFSDENTADFLNSHFVCIKIDREQRPDIDHFLMQFIQAQDGSGGWPLNVFLTPDLRPIYALTYAPVYAAAGQHSMLSIARLIYDYFQRHKDNIAPFAIEEAGPSGAAKASLIESLLSYGDNDYGGFGLTQKFPPHSTLLYLLYYLCGENNFKVETLCRKTLDAMRLWGLNDHLQGGIFRYCVDRRWTIPHFEKMLYDQAMALWTYALAYKVIGGNEYKKMAESIVRCLDESFADKGVYITAHDADTEHVEGVTYVWSHDELKNILTPEEFARFSHSYYVEEGGNFEGRIHLVRKNDAELAVIEEKLLALRKKRLQPARDEKILCGINALTAIAFIQAGRFLENPAWEKTAAGLVRRLIDLFWDGRKLGHSSYKGVRQEQEFLSDAAALLVAVTMLAEDDPVWNDLMKQLAVYVKTFRDGEQWVEARTTDFQSVSASWFDHPVPSGISLAEMGLARVALLTGEEISVKSYLMPYQSDFFNVVAMLTQGLFHLMTTKIAIPWSELPANALQKRGEPETDCYRGTCRILPLSHK